MSERFSFLKAEFIPPNKYHKMFVAKWYLILLSNQGARRCTLIISLIVGKIMDGWCGRFQVLNDSSITLKKALDATVYSK